MLGNAEGGLPPRPPSVVLRFEKPVGFPHETQNLASSEIAVPQYWHLAKWRSRFPFSDRLFESKPFRDSSFRSDRRPS